MAEDDAEFSDASRTAGNIKPEVSASIGCARLVTHAGLLIAGSN